MFLSHSFAYLLVCKAPQALMLSPEGPSAIAEPPPPTSLWQHSTLFLCRPRCRLLIFWGPRRSISILYLRSILQSFHVSLYSRWGHKMALRETQALTQPGNPDLSTLKSLASRSWQVLWVVAVSFRLLSKSLPNLLTRCSDSVGMVASVISKQNSSRTSSSFNMRELDFVGLKLILIFDRSFSRPCYIHLHNRVLLGGCRCWSSREVLGTPALQTSPTNSCQGWKGWLRCSYL